MVVEHELDGFQFDQFADTAVADREVTEKLECLCDDRLTAAPVLQVCNSKNTKVQFICVMSWKCYITISCY